MLRQYNMHWGWWHGAVLTCVVCFISVFSSFLFQYFLLEMSLPKFLAYVFWICNQSFKQSIRARFFRPPSWLSRLSVMIAAIPLQSLLRWPRVILLVLVWALELTVRWAWFMVCLAIVLVLSWWAQHLCWCLCWPIVLTIGWRRGRVAKGTLILLSPHLVSCQCECFGPCQAFWRWGCFQWSWCIVFSRSCCWRSKHERWRWDGWWKQNTKGRQWIQKKPKKGKDFLQRSLCANTNPEKDNVTITIIERSILKKISTGRICDCFLEFGESIYISVLCHFQVQEKCRVHINRKRA